MPLPVVLDSNRNTSVNWGSKFGQASIVPAFICGKPVSTWPLSVVRQL